MTTISEISNAYAEARELFDYISSFLSEKGYTGTPKLPNVDERDLTKYVSEQKWDQEQKRKFKSRLSTSTNLVTGEFLGTLLSITNEMGYRLNQVLDGNLPASEMHPWQSPTAITHFRVLQIWLNRMYRINFKNFLDALQDIRERRERRERKEFFQNMSQNIRLGERQGGPLGQLDVGQATKRGILTKVRGYMKFGKRRKSRKRKKAKRKSSKKRSRKRSKKRSRKRT